MIGAGRTSKAAPRSLKSALFEAGLGEPPRDDDGAFSSEPTQQLKPRTSTRPGAVRRPQLAMPRITLFETTEITASPAPPSVSHTEPAYGVVSPPPWLREARRGRLHARVLNTFGWLTTLVVVGVIVGVAGHFLAVPPSLEGIQSARQ